jgi:ABC-type branched-subunit amino acid transport system ATPase component/ABC-type branched-subunit amino acid transport system permease subunit
MKTMLWCLGGGAALLASLLAPSFLSTFATSIVATAFIFAIFALSLNLILGHAGLPSLGHAVFLGIGAYTVALLVKNGISNFALCAAAGVAASALTALLIGPVLLRTRTVYFLMATLAIGEVLRNVAISWRSVTGGDDGLSGVNAGVVAGIDLGNGRNFYFLALVSLLLVLALMAVLTSAPFGHALRALRDNRSRMAVLGVNPLAVEVTAFVISAGLAGFAGILLAYEKAFVYPTLFSVETSARVLLMVVMGGAGTLLGPVVGAFLVEFIRGIGSVYTDRWQTILGLLAVIVALNSREFLLGGVLSFFRGKFRGSAAEQFAFGTRVEGAVQTCPIVSVPAQPAGAPRVGGRRKERALIKVENIVKRFGGLSVLNGISLEIAPGERRGIIGPNGAGKTTFLNILSSTLLPTDGRIYYGGNDITALPEFRRARLGIGRTFQIANLFNDCTVRENLVLALVAREDYGLRFGRPLSRYANVQREAIELLEKWNVRKIADVKVKLLSYGERRVIEIVLALATRPQLLLLDEPAAGLSSSETKRIIETISALDPGLSIVIVDHNMDLIFSICDQVTVFANGQVLAEGVGDDVRRNKLVMEAYLGMPL